MSITPFVPPSYLSSLPNGIWSGVDSLPVFPFLPGQAINVSKKEQWSTEVATAASGFERRTEYWDYPKWAFELAYEVIRHKPTNDELVIMWEFFSVANGRFAPFLLVDPNDCTIALANAVNFGTGDGATKTFRLRRKLNSFFEPVANVYSPTILDNGGAAGANTVSNGYVTFTTAPVAGHALTWWGYYYFNVRFDEDELGFEQIVNLLWSGKTLKLQSLKT